MKMKQLTAIALMLGLPLVGAVAQQDGPPDGPPPQGGPPMRMHRMPPPIIAALDTNHDGIIDADEIANASAALKTLDRNGTGKLTLMDLMGPPPRRMGGGMGPGPDGGPGPQGMPPGPPPDGMNGTNGMAGHRGMRRIPPVFAALDTNHDGVIDADEIANAPAALKTLDKNGTGQLTIEELLGPRPRGMGMGRGPGGPGGSGPDGGPGPGQDGPPPGGGPDGSQPPPPPPDGQN
jgi:hypothetical protein